MKDSKNLSAFIVKNDKAVKIIVVVGFALILLILLSELFNFSRDVPASVQVSAEVCAGQLEARLVELISEINGVGRVKVMITLEDDGRVRGAAVVAEGGDDVFIKQKVIETVSKVLGISTARVSVVS